MSEKILAWHFVGETLLNGDSVPADGEVLRFDGDVVICESGFHASRRIIDALSFAHNSTICRVECADIVTEQRDKLVCRERTIVWRIADADDLLRRFARQCALSVIDLWDAPEIVRRYLETGDESQRDAAGDAAGAAAWDAAWAARAARAAARKKQRNRFSKMANDLFEQQELGK